MGEEYMIKLTDFEKQKFKQWVIENVDAYDVVPNDEGLTSGLVYNLVQLIDGNLDDRYNYHPKQDAVLKSWGFEE